MSLDTVILLATYNGAHYIEPFLDNLEAQTRQDFRLLVRDDGSSDGTLAAILARQSRLNIEVMPSGHRAGAARSFMELLQFACNGHAAHLFADEDDILLPEKVERAVKALADREHAPVLYCTRQQLVDAARKPLGLSATRRFLDAYNAAVENVVTGCTMGINSALSDLVLQDGLPSGYRMHEAWMYLMATALGQVIHDPWPSVLYRQHGNNTVGASTTAGEPSARAYGGCWHGTAMPRLTQVRCGRSFSSTATGSTPSCARTYSCRRAQTVPRTKESGSAFSPVSGGNAGSTMSSCRYFSCLAGSEVAP